MADGEKLDIATDVVRNAYYLNGYLILCIVVPLRYSIILNYNLVK